MTVKELANTDIFSAVALPQAEREINGVYIGDLLSWVMGRAEADNAWITIMSNNNILAVAALADTSCIILAEGVSLEENIVKTAEEKGINILKSDKNAYEISVALSSML